MRRRMPAVVGAALLLLTAATLSGCTAPPTKDAVPAPASPEPSPTPSASVAAPTGAWTVAGPATTIAAGLAAPWSVVPLEGGRALVSERDSGAVREIVPGGEVRTAGTVPGVVSGGESGLHGIAVRDGWLYVYHGAESDNRVVRLALSGAPGAAALGEPEEVFTGIPRASTHNGGRIAFGPDGLLYVATGDAQDRDAAQDPAALGGKILRLTPEGAPAPGNPFGDAVYSMGHRNVQGLAWTTDGSLWASEFGQNTWDELNRIQPGGNYGWPIVEGTAGDDRFVDPVAQWTPAEASPSGIAAIGDTVFVTGLRGERLWRWDAGGDPPTVVFDG